MSATIDLRIDWLDAPRVSSPDLAATWAAYQLWIGGECVTYVETSDGDDRRSVFGSLYPLAEWIADNWWSLTSDLRPSALPNTVWGWAHSAERPWLMAHNTRGAAQSDQVSSALAGIVDRVLDRLQDKGVPAGPLGARWAAVAESANDPDETEFCVIAARLGLDPYAVDDDIADRLISVADRVPSSLRGDFFSSTLEGMLEEGLEWLAGLGIGLNNPSGGDFILSPVGTHFHRVSRAFAAELLAPAEGISGFLAGGLATEEEIEDLAEHFEVSSRVIEHQYENQLC